MNVGFLIQNSEFLIQNCSDPQSPSSRSSENRKLPLKLPSGDQSAVEPPGPIPNPEVKRRSANGSETIGLVRVGRRQVYARLQAIGAGLFFAQNSEYRSHRPYGTYGPYRLG